MIQVDKDTHRSLKVFCATHDIRTLDRGINTLLNIAYS